MKNTNSESETHPLYPSGDWQGFYIYAQGPNAQQHAMHSLLRFHNQQITGTGFDDVGAFSWSGSYNLNTHTVSLVKSYATHQVSYQGYADEQGIWGNWTLSRIKGGFHIWPKRSEANHAKKEVEAVSELGTG